MANFEKNVLMIRNILILFATIILFPCLLTAQQCRFEKSSGRETATFFEAIEWYKNLDKVSGKVLLKQMGTTDAGYPLHLVLLSNDGKFEPALWHRQKKVVILINNGIHPGEPDGIDASMMLVRDVVSKKTKIPDNVIIAFIPVYNIGGCLNRSAFSRVNQNGPLEYGFRGNSQNLDLNRDFTKCDTKEARSFTQIFHLLDPDILVDNHVSDGADYQYTMTLITTQYDKLGDGLGAWLKQVFEPQVYKGMLDKGWDMTPYVNFESGLDGGMEMFYDPPRYSSGYAALFQTISFIPETHMLKSYADRVRSTYALMQTMIEKAGTNANELIEQRTKARAAVLQQTMFPLSWKVDSTRHSVITFKGYEQAFKTSEATGLQRMFYDRNKPIAREVNFFNVFRPTNIIQKPTAYIIPQGWHVAIDLLKLNGVSLKQFPRDTLLEVEAYHIKDYKSFSRPYEKHHKNHSIVMIILKREIKFLQGDYYIPMDQKANRYIVEMLEPTGDDSFFAWNFFDAVLQQKEGYSDYRWEDVAAQVLRNDPGLRQKVNDKKNADSQFASSAPAQLDFIYRNSPYYEPAHLRYPVYRFVQ